MIPSKKGNALSAGIALLALAIAAGPAAAGPFDAADFGSTPPVDNAVLRMTTAGAYGVAASPEWSWQPATFAACLPSAPCDPLAPSYGAPVRDSGRRSHHADQQAGPDSLAEFSVSTSVSGGDSIRLLVQWRESTTLHEFGGTSRATIDVALDVTLTGLMGFSGIRQ